MDICLREKSDTGNRHVAFAVVMFAMAFVIPVLADDYWDVSKRIDSAPVSVSSGTMESLDAKSRGFDAADKEETVDAWYWTQFFSNECWIKFKLPQGLMLFLR